MDPSSTTMAGAAGTAWRSTCGAVCSSQTSSFQPGALRAWTCSAPLPARHFLSLEGAELGGRFCDCPARWRTWASPWSVERLARSRGRSRTGPETAGSSATRCLLELQWLRFWPGLVSGGAWGRTHLVGGPPACSPKHPAPPAHPCEARRSASACCQRRSGISGVENHLEETRGSCSWGEGHACSLGWWSAGAERSGGCATVTGIWSAAAWSPWRPVPQSGSRSGSAHGVPASGQSRAEGQPGGFVRGRALVARWAWWPRVGSDQKGCRRGRGAGGGRGSGWRRGSTRVCYHGDPELAGCSEHPPHEGSGGRARRDCVGAVAVADTSYHTHWGCLSL